MFKPVPIVHRDGNVVVIDKPSGMHVHQPEFPRRRVRPEFTALMRVRQQIETYLYPVHRLDVSTSGLLLFALNKETASMLGRLFTAGEVEKEYLTVVRGWLPDHGETQAPLELDSTGELVPARTSFETLARVELPYAVGRRHATSRYSVARVRPHSGRFHQIRRHMARLSHPVIGDAMHGDSHHNRFFRETLGCGGLLLRADYLSFQDPRQGRASEFQAPVPARWTQLMERLGLSPGILVRPPTATSPAVDRVARALGSL